jgi:plasmid stability protein
MRTTLDLPDHLIAEIKIRAAKQQRKVKDIIAEVIEQGLQCAPKKASERKEIEVKPIFNGPFPKSLINVNFNHLADTIALEEQLDK